MIKAIVYQSKTGYTKEYAESLSKELKIPCYSVQYGKEKINKKDEIIYLSWIRATTIVGYRKINKKYKIVTIGAVGAYPKSNEYTKQLKEYNHIDSEKYIPHRIKIPIKNLKKEKLAVPDYIKEMFYNNSWPELKELMTDKNWNFITILWWRLSHFLNGITFTSTLINIEESNLLKEIYAKIPDDLKPLVSEAFDYANSVLVEEKIDKFSNQIYLRR